ncbi:uncharacterized protein LOC100898295 [Galendromus occidentalis]|uniref:Uncharacterized protein LOC100898295 n=1 Tax=Galendromus occidentalis TaxID=34638 RepID=A0AAJ7SDU9_9ACAR|nr:uncharacterized protein LOC100898295 [Galendromus occidentalis]
MDDLTSASQVMLQLCQAGGVDAPLGLGAGLGPGPGTLTPPALGNGSASNGLVAGVGESLGSPLVVRRRRQWRESETMMFIRSWEKHHDALKSHRRNAHIYEKMRDELAQNGLNVTTQQIKVKIDNLTQAYRRTMRGAPLRGGDIRWFQYMHRFLGDNFIYQSDSSDEPVALVCPKRSAVGNSQQTPEESGLHANGNAEITSTLKSRIGSEPSEVTSSYVDEERNCSTTPLSSCSSGGGSAVLNALQTSLANATVAASPETTTPTGGIKKEILSKDGGVLDAEDDMQDGKVTSEKKTIRFSTVENQLKKSIRKKCCHHPDILSRKLIKSVERMLQAQLLVAQQALVSQQQLQQALLGQQQLMQCLVALQDATTRQRNV